MIPIKLKMVGFGPYANEINIDFRELKQSKIFIISGPTGSGKTSIFDGICYSLYGIASGDNRSTSTLRSHYSLPAVKTEVSFDFQINGITYNITRSPMQILNKLKGEGTKVEESKVCLKFNDTVLTSISDVKLKISQIIGLTDKQFRKIVLLPQGDFSRLLFSNSSEKVEIFRKIFDTTQINNTQIKLRNDLKELEIEYNDKIATQNTLIKQFGSNLTLNNIDNYQIFLSDNIKKVNDTEKNITAAISGLTNKIDFQISYQTNQKQNHQYIIENENIDAILKQREYDCILVDNQSLLTEFQAINKQIDTINEELNKSKQIITNLTTNDQQLQQEYHEISQQLTKLNNRHVSINALELDIVKYQELVKKFEILENLNIELQSKQLNLEQVNQRLKAINEQLNQSEKQKNQLQSSTDEIEQLHEQLDKVENLLEQVKYIDDLRIQQSELKHEITSVSSQLQIIKDEKASYDSKNLQLVIHQLTSELTDESSCPVCGSVHHPKKVNHLEQIDIDYMQMQRVLDNYEKVNNKLNFLQGQQINLDKQISSSTTNLEDTTTLTSRKIEIVNKLDFLKQTISTYNQVEHQQQMEVKEQLLTELGANKGLYLKITEQVEQLKQELLNYDVHQVSDQIVQLSTQIKQYYDQLEQIKIADTKVKQDIDINNLNLTNQQTKVNEYQTNLNKLNLQLGAIMESLPIDINSSLDVLDNLPKIIEEITIMRNQHLENTGKIKQFQQIFANYQPMDLHQLELELTKLQAKLVDNNEIKNILNPILISLNKVLEQLNSDKHLVEQLATKYKLLSNITNVANGDTKSKISFERYVLISYFQQIIDIANTYLSPMTNNRYTLVLRQEASGRAGAGLDLDILDIYTSTKRDVKSLSGGESFKTALALALGLSDVVQMESGGIKIDTIFIDEGFGSLDSHSLEAALDTLLEIESNGRIVGIISHVEEIKQRINNKIEVIPTCDGSAIKCSFS